MVGRADLYTHLHSVEENLFENELRCRWPDSNALVETMVAGSSSFCPDSLNFSVKLQ